MNDKVWNKSKSGMVEAGRDLVILEGELGQHRLRYRIKGIKGLCVHLVRIQLDSCHGWNFHLFWGGGVNWKWAILGTRRGGEGGSWKGGDYT